MLGRGTLLTLPDESGGAQVGDVVFVTQGMTRGVYNVLHESSGELLGYKSRKKAGKAAPSSALTFSWKKALIDKHIKSTVGTLPIAPC